MSALTHEPDRPLEARLGEPPAFADELVGPATTQLVRATREAIRAELALLAQARLEALERLYTLTKTGQTNASGDALLELFQVPGGATGHLTRLVVDEAAVTPAAPDTAGTLWLAVYAAAGAGITDPAAVIAVGAMLACSPSSPAADAQIPCQLVDADDLHSAPTVVGPATFYLVVDGATAARQLAARFNVVVHQPEP